MINVRREKIDDPPNIMVSPRDCGEFFVSVRYDALNNLFNLAAAMVSDGKPHLSRDGQFMVFRPNNKPSEPNDQPAD